MGAMLLVYGGARLPGQSPDHGASVHGQSPIPPSAWKRRRRARPGPGHSGTPVERCLGARGPGLPTCPSSATSCWLWNCRVGGGRWSNREGNCGLRPGWPREPGPRTMCPTPEVEPGNLLVEVEAAGVNFVDIYHRSGLYDDDAPVHPGPGRGRHRVSGRRGRRGLSDRRPGRVDRRTRLLCGTARNPGGSGRADPRWPRSEDRGRRPLPGSRPLTTWPPTRSRLAPVTDV